MGKKGTRQIQATRNMACINGSLTNPTRKIACINDLHQQPHAIDPASIGGKRQSSTHSTTRHDFNKLTMVRLRSSSPGYENSENTNNIEMQAPCLQMNMYIGQTSLPNYLTFKEPLQKSILGFGLPLTCKNHTVRNHACLRSQCLMVHVSWCSQGV